MKNLRTCMVCSEDEEEVEITTVLGFKKYVCKDCQEELGIVAECLECLEDHLAKGDECPCLNDDLDYHSDTHYNFHSHHSRVQERDEKGQFTSKKPKKNFMRVTDDEKQQIEKRRELEMFELMETFQDRETLTSEQEKIYNGVQESIEAFVLHFNPDYEFEQSDYDPIYESLFLVVKKALIELEN